MDTPSRVLPREEIEAAFTQYFAPCLAHPAHAFAPTSHRSYHGWHLEVIVNPGNDRIEIAVGLPGGPILFTCVVSRVFKISPGVVDGTVEILSDARPASFTRIVLNASAGWVGVQPGLPLSDTPTHAERR